MCVWGGGPLDPADALRRATPHPCLCLASWKVCPAFEDVLGADWQEVGRDFLPELAGEGGRGIRSCPPGTGMSCPLSSGLVFSRPGSWEELLLVSLCPCPPLLAHLPTPSPRRYPGLWEEACDAVSAQWLLHGGHREHVRWLCPGGLWQRHCSHAQLPAWGAR